MLKLFLIFFFSIIVFTYSIDIKCLLNCKKQDISPAKCFKICEKIPSYSIRDIVELSDSEDASPINPKLVWEAYKTQLFDFIKQGTSTKGLQLLEKPIVANWDTKPETLSNFCNQFSLWGPLYSQKAQMTFNAQYYNFLKNLKIEKKSDAKLEADYQKALSELLVAQKDVETKKIECETLFQNRRLFQQSWTYEQFKNDRCFTLKNAETNAFGYQLTVDRLKEQIAGKDAVAFEAISIYEKATEYPWRESFVSSLLQFKTKIQKDANGLSSFSLAVTKSSTESVKREQEWKWRDMEEGKTKTSFIVTENTQTQHEFTTSADIFKLNINAKGYYSIEVSPSQLWYRDIINQYKNGPFIKPETYVGENGNLNLMKQKIYLVYKPSISVFLNKEDATYLQSLKEKKTIIKIGPFETQIENSTEIPTTSSDSEASSVFKIDLISIENDPLIIAVENQVF